MPDEQVTLEKLWDKLNDIDARVKNMEEVEHSEAHHFGELSQEHSVIPGSSLAEWAQEAFNMPGMIDGIVIDEGLARSTPCHRIVLGESSELVYSKGVVGALNSEQKELYCSSGLEDIQATPEMKARQQAIKDAAVGCQAEVADIPKGERLTPFLKCMSVSAKKNGVAI